MLIHILLALSPDAQRARVKGLLPARDVAVAEAADRPRLQAHLAAGDFDLLLVSGALLNQPVPHAVRAIRALPERPDVVVFSETEDAVERAELLALGCVGVLNPSVTDDALRDALRALIDRRREEAIYRVRAERPEEQYSLGDFVSDSPAMQIFLRLARKVVMADTSVLILGETGVGKERLARAIHAEGPHSAGPFMAVNCGALPESLLESELFGHEEGAFTGATRSRKGYFELAHGGTIFLDEIGEIPPHLQVKLLRVLDRRQIQRVGGEKTIEVDVRVMAATNRDLEADMQANRFRPDLFYRLAVVTLTIPPLRERREDIRDLAHSYLEHFRVQTGRQVTSISQEALEVLVRYGWPGNVRELVNAMERAVLLCTGDEISVEDLPVRITAAVRRGGELPARLARPEAAGGLPEDLIDKPISEARRQIVAAFESSYLAALLSDTGGRIGDTAARAGINERSLYDLMKRHGLRKESFRGLRSRPGRGASDA